MQKRLIALLSALLVLAGCARRAPEPFGPVPSEAQLAWQRMEINMFCHFGPNTFSGAEWGSGSEPGDLFRPRALDCSQWVDVAAQAGFGGIILTAKHHDGFCLWPSRFSNHTVPDSLDVLRALRSAIDAHNSPLLMGVYISPWDRNHPTYGTPAYNDVFVNTLREVHTAYGPLFEQWFDGACGEGPNGKRQRYDWPRFMAAMDSLNPQCILFSDIGPGCRWVGNEEGRAGDPCWSTLNTEGATPSDNKPQPSELETGHSPSTFHFPLSTFHFPLSTFRFPLSTFHFPLSTLSWIPAECDVSIRPGWFWHPQEHPKTVDELMEIYYNSVGRNGLLLLNVPPDTNGRISAADSAVLVAFRAERDRIFASDLAQGARVRARHRTGFRADNVLDTAYHSYWAATRNDATLDLRLDSVTSFDIIVIQEYIPLGQRVTSVGLAIDEGDGIRPYTTPDHPLCTTVGYKRIIRLDHPLRTDRLVFSFHALAPPVINRIALYNSAK